MQKRFIFYLSLIIILVLTGSSVLFYFGLLHKAEPEEIIKNSSSPWLTVILMPLDSRPPCTQFVEQLARIANIKIIIPPSNLLDNYKKPADRHALRKWLFEKSKNADMAIISADMLIHGGLIASRQSNGTAMDVAQTLQLLSAIHSQNSQIKLYVFNIIPRLLIADNEGNAKFQKNMLKYSILKDELILFENPLDIEKLSAMEQKLPDKLTDDYLKMYEQNNTVNFSLTKLVEQGIITYLVIGQDDSQPLGLPNINKQKLQQYILHKPALTNKIFITRGTDELALSILGHIITETANYKPKIWVTYSQSEVPTIVMPFMPVSVAQSVKEKIILAGGLPATSPQTADFILYVHTGTKKMQNSAQIRLSAREIDQLIKAGYKVALIDLAEDFYASETLLPELINENADITKLIAYAGWNTTSNSLGTALTQAIAFTKTQHSPCEAPESVRIYKENLEFSITRFLDDYYYQKNIQSDLDKSLKAMKIDPYNLKSYHQQASTLVQRRIRESSHQLFNQALFNKPLWIETTQGRQAYLVTSLQTKSLFPWDRTFEIQLDTKISIAPIK